MEKRKCALCFKEAALQLSHIIPEFFYKSLYDPKHRLLETLTVGVPGKSAPVWKHQMAQKGYRERLLCKSCENKFSRYENYVSQVLPRDAVNDGRSLQDCLPLNGLDYPVLKLFLLSLLWRCGAARKEGPFSNSMNLGPHQEILRQMLVDENPGHQFDYPCVIMAVTSQDKHFSAIVGPPRRARVDSHHIWTIIAGGYVFSYYVSSHSAPNVLREVLLNGDGRMTIVFTDITEIQHVHEGLRQLLHAATKKGSNKS
jgi:hypothetical protein